MTVDLTTTNVLLGILATVSVLETFVVIAVLTTRVNAILDDVKDVTGCAKNAAASAERMAGWWRTFRGA